MRRARSPIWVDGTQRSGYTLAMDEAAIDRLLRAVRDGEVSLAAAAQRLAAPPVQDLGFARVDLEREARQGVPEVVFAPGKTGAQLRDIAFALRARGQSVLATRVSADQVGDLAAEFPELRYNSVARTVRIGAPGVARPGRILTVTAGTGDVPVAEEALETLRACGAEPEGLFDVGVAGLHRLLAELPRLRRAQVLLVVAGMEGALPSVIGGLVAAPVIAIPTSIGYGASFGGLAALLGMLNSCAAGVTVVNIDNGFGAAMAAVRFLDQWAAARSGVGA